MPPIALVKGKDALALKDYTPSGCDWQGTEESSSFCRGTEMLGRLCFVYQDAVVWHLSPSGGATRRFLLLIYLEPVLKIDGRARNELLWRALIFSGLILHMGKMVMKQLPPFPWELFQASTAGVTLVTFQLPEFRPSHL